MLSAVVLVLKGVSLFTVRNKLANFSAYIDAADERNGVPIGPRVLIISI
jgi:hypothetical protein